MTFSVNPTATTNYTLYVKSTAGCTVSKANAATVTVINIPTKPNISVTEGTICAGSAITFTASGGNGSYEWTGDVSATNGSTVTSSSNTPGEYNAAVWSYASGGTVYCTSATETASKTIYAPGAEGESATVCDCVYGTINCSGTCQQPVTPEVSVVGASCKVGKYTEYNQCGEIVRQYEAACETCYQGCTPTENTNCTANLVWQNAGCTGCDAQCKQACSNSKWLYWNRIKCGDSNCCYCCE
jgi:hypothetical protein